jgi:hypothetical protein
MIQKGGKKGKLDELVKSPYDPDPNLLPPKSVSLPINGGMMPSVYTTC